MKCENCGNNEVTFVYRSNLNGKITEKHLCADCAAEQGYIRITRVRMEREMMLMHVINSLGAAVDLPSARAILSNLVSAGALEESVGRGLLAGIGDKALVQVPRQFRDYVRADIMKQVLIQFV